jgi:hypothetical protein
MSHKTIGEIAKFYGQPDWRVRRAVDSLDADIPRAGRYRLVPCELLPALGAEMQRRGWCESSASEACDDTEATAR